VQVGVSRHHYWNTWLSNLEVSKAGHELTFFLLYSTEPSLRNPQNSIAVVFPWAWGAFHFSLPDCKNSYSHRVKSSWSRWAFCPIWTVGSVPTNSVVCSCMLGDRNVTGFLQKVFNFSAMRQAHIFCVYPLTS